MNKSQKLEVMVMKAEIQADEVIEKHEKAWHGAEAKEVEEEEEDA